MKEIIGFEAYTKARTITQKNWKTHTICIELITTKLLKIICTNFWEHEMQKKFRNLEKFQKGQNSHSYFNGGKRPGNTVYDIQQTHQKKEIHSIFEKQNDHVHFLESENKVTLKSLHMFA